jgi:mRNA-degrading endonuclease RelE of RelBE toxin-antitoxin system
MARKFRATLKFDKQFKALDQKTARQAAKAIEFFIQDPAHPSLRVKKIRGADDFYEIRVNMSIRIVVEIISQGQDQINTFYVIGKHEEVFQVNLT